GPDHPRWRRAWPAVHGDGVPRPRPAGARGDGVPRRRRAAGAEPPDPLLPDRLRVDLVSAAGTGGGDRGPRGRSAAVRRLRTTPHAGGARGAVRTRRLF